MAGETKQIHAVNPKIKIRGPVIAPMRSALSHPRNVSSDGLFPPLSMTPLPIGGDQRNFDPYVIAYSLQNGKATKSTGYLNVEPELKAAAAGGGGS